MSASQLSLAAQTQLHENFISLVCVLFYFLCFVVVAVAAAVDLIYWQHCCGRATVAPAENESVLVCMCKRNNVSVCMYVMQIVCPASAKQQ